MAPLEKTENLMDILTEGEIPFSPQWETIGMYIAGVGIEGVKAVVLAEAERVEKTHGLGYPDCPMDPFQHTH